METIRIQLRVVWELGVSNVGARRGCAPPRVRSTDPDPASSLVRECSPEAFGRIGRSREDWRTAGKHTIERQAESSEFLMRELSTAQACVATAMKLAEVRYVLDPAHGFVPGRPTSLRLF